MIFARVTHLQLNEHVITLNQTTACNNLAMALGNIVNNPMPIVITKGSGKAIVMKYR